VAYTLASIDLLLLCVIALSVALLESPVPRAWAFAAVALIAVEVAAMRAMDVQAFEPSVVQAPAVVHTTAEAVAAIAVPALTAALLTVVFFYCARAYAQARRRLEAALRAQAIGNDMPTGWGDAAGDGSCITGSSIGDSATRPRAA
jgi:hypothetical protein